jgi:hypothetical protein
MDPMTLAAHKVERWLSTSASLSVYLLEMAEYHLYAALSRAACCDPMGPDPYLEHREARSLNTTPDSGLGQ